MSETAQSGEKAPAKIAAMGDRDSIYGFAALGIQIFPSDSGDGAATLHRLSESGFAVIYIPEELADAIPEAIAFYRDKPLPAIILIPGVSGNTGSGLREVIRSVERAVGSDILSQN